MLTSGHIHFNPYPPHKEPGKPGRKEIKKKVASEEEKEKVMTLIDKAERILLEIHTLFPFDLFPDKLTIDENKINLTSSEFFFSGRVHSVMIKDISDVLVDTGIFFAKLQIIDKGYIENSIELKFLKKSDALKARRIIQGLVMTISADINLSEIEDESLPDILERLGSTQKPEI